MNLIRIGGEIVDRKQGPIIKIGDSWVFTGEWTMSQMQALMATYESLSQRIAISYVLSAIAILLSLAAIVMARV